MASNPPGRTASSSGESLPSEQRRVSSASARPLSEYSLSPSYTSPSLDYGQDDHNSQQPIAQANASAPTSIPADATPPTQHPSSTSSWSNPPPHPLTPHSHAHAHLHPSLPPPPQSHSSSSSAYHASSRLAPKRYAGRDEEEVRNQHDDDQNNDEMEVIDTAGRDTNVPTYSPGTSLTFSGHDRRINQSLSMHGIESQYLYGHPQASLEHLPRLPDQRAAIACNANSNVGGDVGDARDHVRTADRAMNASNRSSAKLHGSMAVSRSTNDAQGQLALRHNTYTQSRMPPPPAPPLHRAAQHPATEPGSSDFVNEVAVVHDPPRFHNDYPRRPVRFVDEYYDHAPPRPPLPLPDRLLPSNSAREGQHYHHPGYVLQQQQQQQQEQVPAGPGAWHAHHMYLQSLHESHHHHYHHRHHQVVHATDEDDEYLYHHHHTQQPPYQGRQHPPQHSPPDHAAELSSARGPEPDVPSARHQSSLPPSSLGAIHHSQHSQRFAPYNTAPHNHHHHGSHPHSGHSLPPPPSSAIARTNPLSQQQRQTQYHPHHEQRPHPTPSSSSSSSSSSCSSVSTLPRPAAPSFGTQQRSSNSRDRPIYPSTLAPRPPSSSSSFGLHRTLQPVPGSAAFARPNSETPSVNGGTDPVYEIAPINYKLMYDYALDIRECLVRGKPEMLDKFLYSAEILCKVFAGCRVGYDYASEFYQPAPAPQQLRCTSCYIVKTPEWRKGPLGPRTLCNACGLIWGKMSRDRAAKAKARAQAAARATAAATSETDATLAPAPIASSSASSSAPALSPTLPVALEGRRGSKQINGDTSSSSSSLVQDQQKAVGEEQGVTNMVASSNCTEAPRLASLPTNKRQRKSSVESGNEPDCDDGGGDGDDDGGDDVARRRHRLFREQTSSRISQRRRVIVDDDESQQVHTRPTLLASLSQPRHCFRMNGFGDDGNDSDMPVPDLVRYVRKTATTNSSQPQGNMSATISTAAAASSSGSTLAREASTLPSRDGVSESNGTDNADTGKQQSMPGSSISSNHQAPKVIRPSLSFVSRRVYNGPVALSGSSVDGAMSVDVVGDKADMMAERVVMHGHPSETAVKAEGEQNHHLHILLK